MKIRFMTCLALSFFIVFSSCMTRKRLIREKFRSLEGKEDVTVVIMGNSLYGIRWLSETNSVQGNFLKKELNDIIDSRISIINTSLPDDTVSSAKRRVQADILSYRPDIVLLMLGFMDANRAGLSKVTYREQLKELYGILKKHDVFVIVLTTTGLRDTNTAYDSRVERLAEFNEITIWEAGHHNFPVIDVATYMDRMRISANDKYRSMFGNDFILNDKGQEYIMAYVIKLIRKACKK